MIRGFVPSTGYLYFYAIRTNTVNLLTGFVPSTGYLYFYSLQHLTKFLQHGVSSPLRGISISTQPSGHIRKSDRMVSSPLRGISISTTTKSLKWLFRCWFRPLYGVSLFLRLLEQIAVKQGWRFRPLYGVSLFLRR